MEVMKMNNKKLNIATLIAGIAGFLFGYFKVDIMRDKDRKYQEKNKII